MSASFRTHQFALNTSTGTQTITLAGEGTCKGYVLWAVQAITNGTSKVELMMVMGMCDQNGATRSSGVSAQDNVGTTNTDSTINADLLHGIDSGAGGADFELQHDSFVTDGFVIDVVNAPSEAWLITAWILYGSDITTDVVVIDCSDLDDTEVTVSISVDPNIYIVSGSNSTVDIDFSGQGKIGFGFGTDKGSPFDQVGMSQASRNGHTETQSGNIATNTRVIGTWQQIVGFVPAACYEVTTLNSTTLGVKTHLGAAGGSARLNFMLINVNGAVDYDVGTFFYPTSTGVVNHTSPGFKPQFVAMGANSKTNFQNETTNNAEHDSFQFIGSADGTEEICIGVYDEHTETTTNAQSYTNTNLIDAQKGDGSGGSTAEMVATLKAFTSNGWDADYSDAASSAWSGIYLAIEEDIVVKDVIGMGVVPFAR